MSIIISFEGGWGFGKTSILDILNIKYEYPVYYSVVKKIYDTTKMDSFRDNPKLFTKKFFQYKCFDYKEALLKNDKLIFFDRFFFAPIVLRKFLHLPVPNKYISFFSDCKLDKVFVLNPIPLKEYQGVFPRKNVTYEESIKYHEITINVIKEFGYEPIIIEFDSIENRLIAIEKLLKEYL
jgi:predicted ATPase